MDQSLRGRAAAFYERADSFFIGLMARHGVIILRVALAIVFLWFGALKVFGVSPVVALVAATVYWVNPDWFVPFLGIWEMVIGLGLLFRFALRLTLVLLYVQLAGTFLLPIIQPGLPSSTVIHSCLQLKESLWSRTLCCSQRGS